jgi:hypothetical protein
MPETTGTSMERLEAAGWLLSSRMSKAPNDRVSLLDLTASKDDQVLTQRVAAVTAAGQYDTRVASAWDAIAHRAGV